MAELAIIAKWAENLDEATVSRWLVAEGDVVESGDSLCEIITDKATFEYEIDRGGIVKRIYAPPRSVVPVGYVIAFIGAEDEEPPPEIEAQNQRLLEQHRAAAEAELELDLSLPTRGRRERRGGSGAVRGTPAAKRLAAEHDVDLSTIAEAFGKSGVIAEEDVRAYLDRAKEGPA